VKPEPSNGFHVVVMAVVSVVVVSHLWDIGCQCPAPRSGGRLVYGRYAYLSPRCVGGEDGGCPGVRENTTLGDNFNVRSHGCREGTTGLGNDLAWEGSILGRIPSDGCLGKASVVGANCRGESDGGDGRGHPVRRGSGAVGSSPWGPRSLSHVP